jgi:hypothetical protein
MQQEERQEERKDTREALASLAGKIVEISTKIAVKRSKPKGTKRPKISAKIVGVNPTIQGQDLGIDHVILVDSAENLALFRALQKRERQRVLLKAVVVQYTTGGQTRWGLNAISA